MPLIAKRRSEKREADTLPVTKPTPEKRPLLARKRESEKPEVVNSCSKATPPRKLIALRRLTKATDLSAAKISVGGGVRGDYRGERKEGVGTIERGEQGGSEGEETNVPEYLASVVRKAQIAFKRKQTRAANKPAPAPKVDRLWFSIVIEHFPRAVPPLWDNKHRALAKHLSQRIGADHVLGFVKWAVENWTAVVKSEFKWMTKAPAPPTPSFPFLVKFVHVFKEAKEKNNDQPLQVEEMVRGLNLAKKPLVRRESNTPPVSRTKLVLPKKDLSANVSTLPTIPDWRD